ncbi:helix-hairpin-helix domain-containing protein [Brevundimonas sp. NIBR11]|uniref:helix-hairpin-helix domain-containing protein n=1 Tax=Brevundimonas sp. NIBR11 TaxID=3015999 RepID=UPI0022F03294|nr:helix-hairpin-helix domain-containing protein [Brevundimonas sp. NIBR11]
MAILLKLAQSRRVHVVGVAAPSSATKVPKEHDVAEALSSNHFSGLNHRQGSKEMIDLNTASAADLDSVPELQGHGFEIVRYREERGRFDEVRQLEEVPGLAGKWAGAEKTVAVGDGPKTQSSD